MAKFLTKVFLFLLMCVSVKSFFIKPISICSAKRGLSNKQQKLCNKFRNHMEFVVDGSKMALDECKRQFKDRKWNCTFPVNHLRGFSPYLPKGHRETAFVHAIIAAGTFHALSRACMETKLASYCHCSQEPRPSGLRPTYLWAGCGDNLPYGYKFSKMFLDGKEELGSSDTEDISKIARVLMNLHNNEAGRRALMEKSFVQCRCHGLSKGCSTKTCYRQLKPFRKVAEFLKEQHASAIETEISLKKTSSGSEGDTELKLREKYPEFQKITKRDMVYIEDSPNYCVRNLALGSIGTEGRQCNKTSADRLDSCKLLCCGRGHHVKRQISRSSCACQFIWCCHLKCKTCEVEKNVNYCK